MTVQLVWRANLDSVRARLAMATGSIPVVHYTDDAGEAEWIWHQLAPDERERVAFSHRTGIKWMRCACGAPASIAASEFASRLCLVCASKRPDVAELAERYHVEGQVSLLDIAAEMAKGGSDG